MCVCFGHQRTSKSNKLEIKFKNHKDFGILPMQPPPQTLHQALSTIQILLYMHLQNQKAKNTQPLD
jgi:hypothetical protein